MDSFKMSNIKLEKANALKKHRQLKRIAYMFKLLEIGFVLALISRFTFLLPVAVKNSGDYFKDLTVILVSPRFVFVVGNAIVIILFVKSGQFSGQDSSGKNPKSDLYEEFVENSERTRRYEVAQRQKLSTCVKLAAPEEDASVALEKNNFQRSKSENLSRPKSNKSCLRRSVTEISKKDAGSDEGSVKKEYPEDRMSNEEFRCTIEAFIARHKQFRRDEENSYLIE